MGQEKSESQQSVEARNIKKEVHSTMTILIRYSSTHIIKRF